jgi:hypothetical protein
MNKGTLSTIFLTIGILFTSCEKNKSYGYEFLLVNETTMDLYVKWNIDGSTHFDTIPFSTDPSAKKYVRHGLNSSSEINLDVLNGMYSCEVVSSDSSKTWNVSDLNAYSLNKSSEPFFNLVFETYSIEIQ